MIDFLIDNSKIICVILIPVIILVPISICSMLNRKHAEVEALRKYVKLQIRQDETVSDTVIPELTDAKEIVSELKENVVGTEGTMKDISDLESFLDSITNNIYHLTINNDYEMSNVKKALDNLPFELDFESSMGIYLAYMIAVMLYKIKTRILIEEDDVG